MKLYIATTIGNHLKSLKTNICRRQSDSNYQLNDDKDVVFTRKFILYENLVTVPMQVKRTRTVSNVGISII
jgi:hypothetical protein